MVRNPRSVESLMALMALVAAVVLGLTGCASSTTDRAGGRGLQEVTVLEIAQLDDVAPPHVQAYAAEVEKESHGSLSLHFATTRPLSVHDVLPGAIAASIA